MLVALKFGFFRRSLSSRRRDPADALPTGASFIDGDRQRFRWWRGGPMPEAQQYRGGTIGAGAGRGSSGGQSTVPRRQAARL
ncbi:hypothetical protein KIF59_07560 [Enterobacter cloacae subsp. cloacae]|nr:hypothetical protein [Enterobacter cloacae subsp. cloacae]